MPSQGSGSVLNACPCQLSYTRNCLYLKWFCDKCDKLVIEGSDKAVSSSQSSASNYVSDDRIDKLVSVVEKLVETRMWANAQPDGRPAEHRWRPLFNAAKFG